MEIIKDAGEQPTPRLHRRLAAEVRPILAVRGAGTTLLAGSRILARRGWTLLAEHVDGWERYAALAFGGYVVVYACGHAPHMARFVVPAAVVAWCAAAWWVTPPAPAVEEPEAAPTAEAPQAFTQWLLDTIGDRPGIHLRELYPAMRRLPGCERHDDAQLRAALQTFGIPVHRSLRIGVVAGRSGVRRGDLEALPTPDREDPTETYGDAGQSADSPPLSTSGEGH
jgi:hypothetical protein